MLFVANCRIAHPTVHKEVKCENGVSIHVCVDKIWALWKPEKCSYQNRRFMPRMGRHADVTGIDGKSKKPKKNSECLSRWLDDLLSNAAQLKPLMLRQKLHTARVHDCWQIVQQWLGARFFFCCLLDVFFPPLFSFHTILKLCSCIFNIVLLLPDWLIP